MIEPDLSSFAEITARVIESDGFDEYLPTILAEKDITVVDGIPVDLDHREAIQRHADRLGLTSREFFFGVRSGPSEITTGHYRPGNVTIRRIVASERTLQVLPEEAIGSWWWLGL